MHLSTQHRHLVEEHFILGILKLQMVTPCGHARGDLELHCDKFPTLSTLSCWKIIFKTQVSACFSSLWEAMSWIEEVEMVDSEDDLKSSHSLQGCTHFPNFEMLDAKIASALNKIIQNSTSRKRAVWRKAQQGDRFLRGRQIVLHDLRQFPGYWCSCTVLDYADLLTSTLRNDDVQEFDTSWHGILLSMTKIPSDGILEGLYKLRIRQSEKPKTVLEFL